MGEEGRISLNIQPPGAAFLFREGEENCNAVLGIAPEYSTQFVGPFHTRLQLPVLLQFCGGTSASTSLRGGIMYRMDNPAASSEFLTHLSLAAQIGAETGEGSPFFGGLNAEVGLFRIGPVTVSAGVTGNIAADNNLMAGLSLSIPLARTEGRPPVGGHTSIGRRAQTGELTPEEKAALGIGRPDLPLAEGFTLGEFRHDPKIVQTLADLFRVSQQDLATHLAETDTLKPDNPVVANSPLAAMVQGGGETVIAILRSMTPDRDHILDPADTDLFFGIAKHISLDLYQRIDDLRQGKVFNDWQSVFSRDRDGDYRAGNAQYRKEVLPRAITSFYFPHDLYPQMTPQRAAEIVGDSGRYDEWAAAYRDTDMSNERFQYFYLVAGIDGDGINYNYPPKILGQVGSNRFIPGSLLLNPRDYQDYMNRHRNVLRAAGHNIQPQDVPMVTGLWLHFDLLNGDTYSLVAAYVRPGVEGDFGDLMLAGSRNIIMSATAESYVRFAEGMAHRSGDPEWRRPALAADDWPRGHFSLGNGTRLGNYLDFTED